MDQGLRLEIGHPLVDLRHQEDHRLQMQDQQQGGKENSCHVYSFRSVDDLFCDIKQIKLQNAGPLLTIHQTSRLVWLGG